MRKSAAILVGSCVAMGLVSTGCGGGGSDSGGGGGSIAGGGGFPVSQGGSTSPGGSSGISGSPTATAGSSSTGGSPGTAGTAGTTGSAPASGGSVSPSGGGASLAGSGGATPSTGGSAGAAGTAAGGTSSSGGSGGSSAGGSSSAGNPGTCGASTPISKSTCAAGESNCFSFFVASRARMFKLAQAFNGSTKGWGGDFRYGTQDGLTGADKLCTQIAEESLPGNCRTWRAFLSTSKVNAISRVGSGPWYDRLNRTIAKDLTELAATRPGGITVSTILNNLPNEDGTPHHNEEADCANANSCADNHDVLTGSDSDGKVCTSTTCMGMGGFGGKGGGTTITDFTCMDWTLGTSMAGVAPQCGHTWPTMTGGTDDWISRLTESGCAPGYNLVQNGGPMPSGNGSVGDGGGYGAIYCLALSE
jgi:hypothetical protein